MKKFSYLMTTMLLLLSLLSACGDNDESPISPGDNTGSGNANNGNGSQDLDIKRIIAQNTAVSSYYADYAYYISLSTTLQKALPGKEIVYGIQYQYTRDCPGIYFIVRITEETKYRIVHVDINTNKTQYDIIASIFVDTDSSPYVEAGFYWPTYMALEEMMANGESLKDDEQDLYDNIVDYMNEAEKEAKRQLIMELFVEIDGVGYLLKEL